jgi:hypothetical protein
VAIEGKGVKGIACDGIFVVIKQGRFFALSITLFVESFPLG